MLPEKVNEERFVLASVFDKRGVVDFCSRLTTLGYRIMATEGTGRELTKGGIPSVPAHETVQKPGKPGDYIGDYIKTLSFEIEAGILFDRSKAKHVEEAMRIGVSPVDVVICNFPPLNLVVQTPGEFNIKNVDVGGPHMIRTAAVNFWHVLVVVDPDDYEGIADAMFHGIATTEFKRRLAIKAFAYVNSYSRDIMRYLDSME